VPENAPVAASWIATASGSSAGRLRKKAM
jgi:hypothetical protein